MTFHKSALFTDMSENYLTPCQASANDKVHVRFRTGRNNADCVRICYNGQKAMMKKEASDELFDYYGYHIRLTQEPLYYHFEIESGEDSCYYNRIGAVKNAEVCYDFILIPGFFTPDWMKGAVMYQIFVDRFCNGDPSNDVQDREYRYLGKPVERITDWNALPKADDTARFYGGDLQGVIDKLDYLTELGIDVIYLNPIFVSPSNHKYDTQDYEHVDPHFGKIVTEASSDASPKADYRERTTDIRNLEASDKVLIRLIEEAHKRNIRVILDGVFNHCGSFHKFLNKEGVYTQPGAYQDVDSPFAEYFAYDEKEDRDSYEKWWDFDTLPKLNYEGSRKLYEYILSIGAKWVSKPYCADGWRLDVAADLGHSREFNHQFWQDFRRVVKEANPEAIIIAEHYGPAKDWLAGNEWDSVMNYDAFMEPITWFLTGMNKHSDQSHQEWLGNSNIFWTSMTTAGLNFTHPSGMTAMNELSNHDHSRFLTRTNHVVGRLGDRSSVDAQTGVDPAVMRMAVVMQMTWPGTPTIYYGDEAGVCGFTDPDNRRTYPWGQEDLEMLDFHKAMIRLHKENPELLSGSMIKLYAQPFVTAYARFTQDEQTIVIINCSDSIKDLVLPVWRTGIPLQTRIQRIMVTTSKGYNKEIVELPVVKGKIEVSLLAQSAMILKHKNKGLMGKRTKTLYGIGK